MRVNIMIMKSNLSERSVFEILGHMACPSIHSFFLKLLYKRGGRMGFFVVLTRFSLFLRGIISFRLEEFVELGLLETRRSETRGHLLGLAHWMQWRVIYFGYKEAILKDVNMQMRRKQTGLITTKVKLNGNQMWGLVESNLRSQESLSFTCRFGKEPVI